MLRRTEAWLRKMRKRGNWVIAILGLAMLSGCVVYEPAPRYREVAYYDPCPPSPRVEVIAPCPYRGAVWHSGYWGRAQGSWGWRHGCWR
jgi:hypothetical protein